MGLSAITPAFVKNMGKRARDFLTWDPWAFRSWSQEGEDILLYHLMEGRRTGFYVDIGAHHPKRFSNTYLFYRLGWHGINVDAMPGSMDAFRRVRPRDINIEIGVARSSGVLEYYVFDEPALNGFSSEISKSYTEGGRPYRIEKVIEVSVTTLSDILSKHASSTPIDFLSVDAEGLDLEVLESNDWSRFRPRCVLTEIPRTEFDNLSDHPIASFLAKCEYKLQSKLTNSVFFLDRKKY